MRKTTMMAAAAMVTASLGVSTPAMAGTDTYLGEVMLVGFNFCPRGYINADGALLAISSNTALFSLYGTTYGGNGTTTFAMPDLRGRVPISVGQGPGLSDRVLGETSGSETTTLTIANMPNHSHSPKINVARAQADTKAPVNASFARATTDTYNETTPPGADQMTAGTVTSTAVGGGQSVNNMQPYLTLRYCVASQGIFPSRN